VSPQNQKLDADRVDPIVGPALNPPDPRLADQGSITDQGSPKTSLRSDVINLIRGFCMGAANIVPGVSGGTVALVMGHYQRLIDAVSRVDSHLLKQLVSRRWREAWDYVDARFLFGIAGGVVIGTAVLTGFLTWLFDERMPETFAVFFGMILASVLIVRRQVKHWNLSCYLACGIGVLAALAVGRLSPTDGGNSLIYLFFAASIAICAMILPGISGSFILLLLGVYHPVIASIKSFFKMEIDLNLLLLLSVFALGCVFGLLAFSRLLSWMLDHHRDKTMSALVGLMIGSVEKLWPLQMPTPATAGLKMKERVMQVVPPGEWDGSLILLIALAVGAAVFVLALERVAASEPVTDRETGG
jgi:putative membrane protein